jgi:CheY-like chemotaxis protein
MDTGQSKRRLLLVDGDPKSLRVLEVSLKKAGFEVVTATQGNEALGALQAALPDLIISDTDLDGMDGFDLCRQIKAKPEWAKIPFLFVSGRKSIEDKIRGLELGVDDYLTKPIYIKEIGIRVRTALQRAERERLESRREGRTKFAGDLSDIGVVDLVQTIDLNRKSGIIHIVNRDGRRGAVFFREGRVIDAEVGRLSGAEAMYRLFSWSEGRFEVEFKPIRRRDVIDLPSAALLMEGMRRLDEWTRLLERLPALDSVVEVDFRVLGEQLADLPDEMNGILRLCDGTRSLLAVIDDSDFPDLEALTMASKLFGQGIIYARQPVGRPGEAEPGGELARWLAEGSAEDGASADEASAGQQFVTEAEAGGSRDIEAGERRPAADDVRASGERQAADMGTLEGLASPFGPPPATTPRSLRSASPNSPAMVRDRQSRPAPHATKTLKTFSLDIPIPSLDPTPSTQKAQAASTEPEQGASGQEPTRNPLSFTSTLPKQQPAHAQPVGGPALPPTSQAMAEAASPLEGSAVVESSWREPGELAMGLPRTGGVGATPAPPAKSAADGAGVTAKPDTLRGIPIPEELAEADQAGPAQQAPVSDHDRPARTTIEFAPQVGDFAPVASAGPTSTSAAQPAGEAARETDWGGWAQGTESKPAAESEPPQAAASAAEAGAEAAQAPAGASEERPPLASEFGHADARTPDEAPQTQQADQRSATAERTLVINEDQRSKARATLDKLDSDVLPHERRWPLFVVILALLVGAGLLAIRIGPTGSRSNQSPRSGSLPDTAPLANASPAIEAGQGITNQGVAQSVDHVPGAQPTSAAELKPGSQPVVASGEKVNQGADGGQDRQPTPGTAGLGEHCRKVDAGGRGRPTAILAACRPAIEAEPGAADIMVILARVELDRERAAEARSWAKKALGVNPNLADAYVFLGGAEQEIGNPDAAKAAYKKYLELAPTGRHARELRAVLDSL